MNFQRLKRIFFRYVVFRGRDVPYLRWMGARVGEGCDIKLKKINIGSEPWLLEIGDNVTLATGCQLLMHDGTTRLFRHQHPDKLNTRFGNSYAPIKIKDNCFIGAGAIVLPGITIGPDSIVAAGSVVTKDVLPRTIVAGNPARCIKTLDALIETHLENYLPIAATNKQALRTELTEHFFGRSR